MLWYISVKKNVNTRWWGRKKKDLKRRVGIRGGTALVCSRLSDSLIDTLEMCSCNLVCRLFFFFFSWRGEKERERNSSPTAPAKGWKPWKKKIKNKKVSKKKKNYLIYTSRRREKDPFWTAVYIPKFNPKVLHAKKNQRAGTPPGLSAFFVYVGLWQAIVPFYLLLFK